MLNVVASGWFNSSDLIFMKFMNNHFIYPLSFSVHSQFLQEFIEWNPCYFCDRLLSVSAPTLNLQGNGSILMISSTNADATRRHTQALYLLWKCAGNIKRFYGCSWMWKLNFCSVTYPFTIIKYMPDFMISGLTI